MFSFFEKNKQSLLDFTSIINDPTLDGADTRETGSSLDSHHRKYDDDSSLGSYSDVEADNMDINDANSIVCEEVQGPDPGIETSLSNQSNSNVENQDSQTQTMVHMPMRDLRRLVGMISEEEIMCDMDMSKPEMPPYKIR